MVAGGALASSKHGGDSLEPDVATAGALFTNFPLREVIALSARRAKASSRYPQENSSIPLCCSLVAPVFVTRGLRSSHLTAGNETGHRQHRHRSEAPTLRVIQSKHNLKLAAIQMHISAASLRCAALCTRSLHLQEPGRPAAAMGVAMSFTPPLAAVPGSSTSTAAHSLHNI